MDACTHLICMVSLLHTACARTAYAHNIDGGVRAKGEMSWSLSLRGSFKALLEHVYG